LRKVFITEAEHGRLFPVKREEEEEEEEDNEGGGVQRTPLKKSNSFFVCIIFVELISY
jgi:hypothetical protein